MTGYESNNKKIYWVASMRKEKMQPVSTIFVMLHFLAHESKKPKAMKRKIFRIVQLNTK